MFIRPCTCQRCRPCSSLQDLHIQLTIPCLCVTQICEIEFQTEAPTIARQVRQVIPKVCCACLDLPWMGQKISNPAMPSWEWIHPRVPQRSVRSVVKEETSGIPKFHSISSWHHVIVGSNQKLVDEATRSPRT